MLCCLYYYYTLWSPHCYVRFCEDIITLQSYWSQRVRLSVYFFSRQLRYVHSVCTIQTPKSVALNL